MYSFIALIQDGTDRKDLVSHNIRWPNGLTLSDDGGYLYYLENYQKMKTISQVDTVTGERKEIYKLSKNTFYAIDFFNGNLFFAGRDNPIEGADFSTRIDFITEIFWVNLIKLYTRDRAKNGRLTIPRIACGFSTKI